jgi:hypothetical protein
VGGADHAIDRSIVRAIERAIERSTTTMMTTTTAAAAAAATRARAGGDAERRGGDGERGVAGMGSARRDAWRCSHGGGANKKISTTSSGEGIARASPRRASWILRAAERTRRIPYTPHTPHRPHERTSERRVARPGHARAKLGSDLQAARASQAGVRGVWGVRGSEMSGGKAVG